jgi:OmpA-OmpF porin, OOP family
MRLFDPLVDEVKQRLGLGAEVDRLLSALLSLVVDEQQGGLAGFLSRFHGAGLGDLVSSWLGQGPNTALSAGQVEQVLGGATVERLGSQAGMSRSTAASALALLVPGVVDRLTPGGVVPNARNLIGTLGGYLGGTTERVRTAEKVGTYEAPERRKGSNFWWWLIPLLLLGLLAWWLFGRRAPAPEQAATPAPETTAPAPAPTVPGEAVDSVLTFRNDNGKIYVSGTVPDAATRDKLVADLRATFGEGNVNADITVNPRARTPAWLARIGELWAALKLRGADLHFEGDRISVGGTLTDAQRAQLMDRLRSLWPSGISIGTYADRAGALVESARSRAAAALGALGTAYTGEKVVDALNLSIINFATDNAEIPAEDKGLIEQAAKAIQGAPAGTVIEVGGHTDSTGDAAANMKLSQARAESVVKALTSLGVSPSSLTAKGYGSTRPVASNDTEAGRFQNRRIEYSVVKS